MFHVFFMYGLYRESSEFVLVPEHMQRKQFGIFPSLKAYTKIRLSLEGKELLNFLSSIRFRGELGIFPSFKAYVEGKARNFSKSRSHYVVGDRFFQVSRFIYKGKSSEFFKSRRLYDDSHLPSLGVSPMASIYGKKLGILASPIWGNVPPQEFFEKKRSRCHFRGGGGIRKFSITRG